VGTFKSCLDAASIREALKKDVTAASVLLIDPTLTFVLTRSKPQASSKAQGD
jgi:hypothetical protein